MIDFQPGSHGEVITDDEKNYIVDALKEGSHSQHINALYNNYHHMQMDTPLYTDNFNVLHFLDDIYTISKSSIDTLIVRGGIHSNYHATGIFGQYNTHGEFQPLFVKDTYIQFEIKLKYPKKLRILHPNTKYHFLIYQPIITSHKHNIPIYIPNSTPTYLYPIVEYAKKSVRFIGY